MPTARGLCLEGFGRCHHFLIFRAGNKCPGGGGVCQVKTDSGPGAVGMGHLFRASLVPCSFSCVQYRQTTARADLDR